MHVHIATIGGTVEPITKALNAIPGVDKVYLICSKKFNDVADEVMAVCKKMLIEPHKEIVSGFDFQEIVATISKIYGDEHGKGVKFSINITGGTNLMAAAACSCAFFIGATIYYVHWKKDEPMSNQLEIIPAPHTPNLSQITGKTREILFYIMEHESDEIITNKLISGYFAKEKQNSSYHLRKLEHEGLIQLERGVVLDGKMDKRMIGITLTNQGKLIASWLKDSQ